jgi:FkbM family methyltransferase
MAIDIKIGIPVRSSCGIPILNCSDYLRFPRLSGFPSHIFSQIKAAFGPISSSQPMLNAWSNRFQPNNCYPQEVLHTFKLQMAVGIQCTRLYNVMPPTLRRDIDRYIVTTRREEARKYQGVQNSCLEVFCFHHGLRRLYRRIQASLKTKSFIDIGAFNGDSALVLSDYAKNVYSLELSGANFAVLNRVLCQNPVLSAHVHAFHVGVSNQEGESSVTGHGAGAKIAGHVGELVKIVTIDKFVQEHNLIIGFLKGDVEGHAAAIVTGATETMLRDRPIFSFSAYHDFSEMYNMSIFLMDLLPNYYFEWHMENTITIAFFEISLFGRPRQLWEVWYDGSSKIEFLICFAIVVFSTRFHLQVFHLAETITALVTRKWCVSVSSRNFSPIFEAQLPGADPCLNNHAHLLGNLNSQIDSCYRLLFVFIQLFAETRIIDIRFGL